MFLATSGTDIPVVYLDSQDYSRFGDVLRGKADKDTEKIFRKLEEYSNLGRAIFAISMPVLAEILQYDADHKETTLRKAEAVERLCGGWALAFPGRIVAFEIAKTVQRHGVASVKNIEGILSSDRYW